MRTLAAPLIGFALLFTLPFDRHGWWLAAVAGLAGCAAALPITIRRVRRIATSDYPVLEAVQAVSVLASLVVFGFAASYVAIAQNTDQFTGLETRVDALYFTIVTLGTVGYGDITPTGQAARALVALQIVLNLTLVGLSIRLVAKAAAERRAEEIGR